MPKKSAPTEETTQPENTANAFIEANTDNLIHQPEPLTTTKTTHIINTPLPQNTAYCPTCHTYQSATYIVDDDARFIFNLQCGHDLALELKVVASGQQVKQYLKK
jgi:hypothetical protein